MQNSARMLIAAGLVTIGLFALWPRGATAEKPSTCLQWEVMVAPATRIANEAKPLPELGKPFVEQAPAGWEPFAFGPTGMLVFRRCAK